MAQQTVNVGTGPNTGTGDPLRDAYIKINQNFDEVYPLLPTSNEKAALPGPDGHAPSTGNKYVTVSYLAQQLEGINTTVNFSASNRVLGRITSGAGPAEELTGTQVTTLLDTFTSTLKGVVPPSGGGTVNFLRADGSWASPSVNVTDGDKGDITVSSSGTVWTIDNSAVTYSKIQNVSTTSRVLGRITSGAGNIEELTGTQLTTLLDPFTSTLKGVVPASGGGTTTFLRADGTWSAPPSYSATNGLHMINNIIRLGGTIIQDTVFNIASPSLNGFKIDSSNGYSFGIHPSYPTGGISFAYGDFITQTTQYVHNSIDPLGLIISAKDSLGNKIEFHIKSNGVVFFDDRSSKKGIQYSTSGYETTDTSLITRKYAQDNFASKSVFTSTTNGLVPASGGGTTNFLRADGSWAAVSASVPDGDKGHITVSNSGATWLINDDAVSYAKIQNVSATSRILGRITTGAGNIEELTGTQATTLLDVFTSTLKGVVPASGGSSAHFLRADGLWTAPPDTTYSVFTSTVNGLVPASGGGTTNFLRADGTWAAPPSTGLPDGDKGDITVTGGVWSIDDGVVTNSKLGSNAVTTVKINNGAVTDSKITSVAWSKITSVPTFAGSSAGLVPASAGGTTDFLRADGTWAAPSGGGGGVTTIGTIDSQTKSTNGAVISGTSLVMQTADATRPGLVSTGTQTFAGIKTFNNRIGVGATSLSTTMLYVKGDGSLANLFRVEDSSGDRVFSISETGNVVMNTIGFLTGPKGVIALGNAPVPPAVAVSTGGFLYAEAGALKWRGSSGTVTTIANA